MNRVAWILVFLFAAALVVQLAVAPARSTEGSASPFVGLAHDGNHWCALRANGEVYLSEGASWLDRMEYRYTIGKLEKAFTGGK